MGTAGGGREQADAECQEEEDTEADRKILPACPRNGRFERTALMLHEQLPSPEVIAILADDRREWILGSNTSARLGSRYIANRARRTSEQERLTANPEERR